MTGHFVGQPCRDNVDCVKTSICLKKPLNNDRGICRCEHDRYEQDNRTCVQSMI